MIALYTLATFWNGFGLSGVTNSFNFAQNQKTQNEIHIRGSGLNAWSKSLGSGRTKDFFCHN